MIRLRLHGALLGVALPVAAGAQQSMYHVHSDPDRLSTELAFDTRPAATLDDLVKQLTHAVGQLTRYKNPDEPPAIHRVPRAELERYACRGQCSIQAWYMPEEGIFLDETLRPETNLYHRSILLHELVHYFQDRAGEYAQMSDCQRWFRREVDAYAVQNRYLGAIGHPRRVAFVGENC
jgi:hypothetical protein